MGYSLPLIAALKHMRHLPPKAFDFLIYDGNCIKQFQYDPSRITVRSTHNRLYDSLRVYYDL